VEEGDDCTFKLVTFLEEFVEKDDNKGGGDELNYKQQADTSTEVRGLAMEPGQNIHGCLAERDDEGKDCLI